MRLRALKLVVTGDGRHLPGDLFDAEEKEAARLVELAAAEPDEDEDDTDLSKMKKDELIGYAESLGIELAGNEKKDELTELIEGYKEGE
ncbi:hypothetical protein [Hydrogenimonas sp.]